jgi:hypothetical protein
MNAKPTPSLELTTDVDFMIVPGKQPACVVVIEYAAYLREIVDTEVVPELKKILPIAWLSDLNKIIVSESYLFSKETIISKIQEYLTDLGYVVAILDNP